MALVSPERPDRGGVGRLKGAIGPLTVQPPREAAIARLAAGQHGVFALAQLEALGLSASAVRKRAATGRLHRIHHAVYSLVPRPLLTREGPWMAAVLACGPGAVLSHRSAATLHGLRPSGARLIDVTAAERSRCHHSGVRTHRSTTLTPADVTVVNGIPCTTVARTLLDLAEVLPRRLLERACDQAEIEQTFDLTAVQDQLARNPGRRGARKLRAILGEHYIAQTPTRSELEELFLAIAREAGLPAPLINAYIDTKDGEPPLCVDFVWPEQRVAVEVDGRRTHATAQAFDRDRRRDQRLTVAAWRPLRFTWRQLTGGRSDTRATLIATIAPARGASSPRRSRGSRRR
jgi:hypothetical protein